MSFKHQCADASSRRRFSHFSWFCLVALYYIRVWRELSNCTPSMMGPFEEIAVSVVSSSLVLIVREIAAWQLQDYLD